MKVYFEYQPFTPVLLGGTSQAGYGPENLENTAIYLPWYSSNRNLQSVRHQLSGPLPIHHVFWHDTNFDETQSKIYLGRTDSDFDEISTGHLGQTDNYDRHWVHFAPYENGYTDNYQYVWIETLANEDTLDGRNYYRIGASYIMTASVDLGLNPAWGSDMEHIIPGQQATLPNGARVISQLGPEYDIIQLRWQAVRERDQYPDYWITRGLRSGPIIIDMEYHPWDVWPVVWEDISTQTTWSSPELDDVTLTLRELVTL